MKRKIQSSVLSGKICRKMQHSHSKGQHVVGLPGDLALHRPVWLVKPSQSSSPQLELQNISCGIVLCFESAFVVVIAEVNRKQSSVIFGGKKKKKQQQNQNQTKPKQTPLERCGGKSLIPLGSGRRVWRCSLVTDHQLCHLIRGLFLLLAAPNEVMGGDSIFKKGRCLSYLLVQLCKLKQKQSSKNNEKIISLFSLFNKSLTRCFSNAEERESRERRPMGTCARAAAVGGTGALRGRGQDAAR